MHVVQILLTTLLIAAASSLAQEGATLVKAEKQVVETEIVDPQSEQLQNAQKLFEQEKHADCITVLSELLQSAPELADAHRLQGHAYRAIGKDAKARIALGKAASLGRMTPNVLTALLQLDTDTGRDDAALVSAKMLLLVDPNDESIMRTTVGLWQRRGDHASAEPLLRRLLEKHPDDLELLAALGSTLQALGRTIEAQRLLERAWLLGSKLPQIPLNLAAAHQRQGNHELALEWLDRCPSPKSQKEADERLLQKAFLLEAKGDAVEAHAIVGPLLNAGSNRPQAVALFIRTAPQSNRDVFQVGKQHADDINTATLTMLANQARRNKSLELAQFFYGVADKKLALSGSNLRLYADVEIALKHADSAKLLLIRSISEDGLTESTQYLLTKLHQLDQ